MTEPTTTADEAPAFSMPSERMGELRFFVGTWDAPGVFHETPFGPRKPIEMRIDGDDADRGFWITLRTTELPSAENPAPLTARYVWGYDPSTDEFVAEWFDSNGGRASQRSRGWINDQLEFIGTITMNGSTVPLRDIFTRRGKDAYHHIGAIDLGSGWMPVDEENAVRRAGQL